MNYSIIVPVYNRPDEVDELLESLTHQVFRNFEVVIVEDGSEKKCDEVCAKYKDLLPLRYYYKKNSGPGSSRNFGVDYANGDYVIILDSDVVVPPHYLSAIDEELSREQCDFFGGADAAHASFTPVQKAISYSMTSFFTTGGIRGGKKKLDKFYPRSYNMGVRRTAYQALGGFSRMRFGEDIDFSYRLIENGYKSRLFPEAWVWHKRRTDLRKFFRQVYNSGIARINLEKRHPGTMKPVHLLPMLFTLGVLLLLLLSPWCLWTLTPLLAYALIICIHSSVVNKSLRVGLLSVPAAFTQLMGYGLGFINAWWKRCVLRQDEFQAFEKTFYK
ncbi:MAG: glycosyltransferase [Prevotella sp.]|nr:glycosyltransferase [Prevotella sp.]